MNLPRAKVHSTKFNYLRFIYILLVAGISILMARTLVALVMLLASCTVHPGRMEKGEAMARAGLRIKVKDCVGDVSGWVCWDQQDTVRVMCTGGSCVFPVTWNGAVWWFVN